VVYSSVVTYTPRELWLDQKARRAGFSDGAALLAACDARPYRAEQLYRAVCKELVDGVARISVLPVSLRDRLAGLGVEAESIVPVAVQRSRDGQTTKGLFRLADGSEVESVLMEHHGARSTVCISSQAGCAYRCAFCSTGQAGFTRNLESLEIFEQALHFARALGERGKRVTNVVLMGQGEPLANPDAVAEAIALLTDSHGFGLGHRHITISTVGLVPEIERFEQRFGQVNLAISLHAPSDDQRSAIMPVNRRYPVAELIAATDRYIARTHRKVFIEYVMLAGVNDDERSARALGALLRGRLYHVNLIPYNETPDAAFAATAEARIRAFASTVNGYGVPTTVRVPMGRDIAAACGQLRAETQPRAHAS
jgi:23S rRNA (adenine2503-C2)-methyltransferase